MKKDNNYDEALKIAQQLQRLEGEKKIYVSPYNIALIYAQIPGKEDDAFHWLDFAIAKFDTRVAWLKVDPRFSRLRKSNEIEFNRRLQAAKLPI